tara:strand:- start:21 stop:782 length:762 start_codon:yes stop_codon:yes gene_type:complete|eukprot:scaffold63423_cov68-Phaeocystis_antarctica.AAC.2
MSSVNLASSLAKRKKAEVNDLAEKLALQQQALKRKEQELAELHRLHKHEEQTFQKQNRDAGSRDQRVDVSTLKGTHEITIKQVGREMASAIKRRQDRLKKALHERLNKQKIALDHAVAHNRELRGEIEQGRYVRIHHLAALKKGGTDCNDRTTDISGMIVSAQRAYAERETCALRQTELHKELAQDGAQWEATIEDIAAEMVALDDECAHRDHDLEETEKDCANVAAVARRAEAEQERQLEHYASVRNKRLEH